MRLTPVATTMTAQVKPFRPLQSEPCRECPFRRKSMPGWLGAAIPEEFVMSVSAEEPLPCHLTIDYDDADWEEQWRTRKIGKLCAGSLIYARNTCKQFSPTSGLPTVPADRENVFSTPIEFITHHRSLGIVSGEMHESSKEKPVPKKTAKPAAAPKQTKLKPTPQRLPPTKHTSSDSVDEAIEEILQEIDEHELSGTSFPKDTTREFWNGIIDGLRTRLSALNSDEE